MSVYVPGMVMLDCCLECPFKSRKLEHISKLGNTPYENDIGCRCEALPDKTVIGVDLGREVKEAYKTIFGVDLGKEEE